MNIDVIVIIKFQPPKQAEPHPLVTAIKISALDKINLFHLLELIN
jgi:hypothetical protein